MATIALYADKINNMPGLAKDAGNSVACLKAEMFGIKSRSLSINQSICDMEDVISSISASTQTQEDKVDALNRLGEDVRQFAAEADRIDGDVADKINDRKKDFYDKYSYLKPDSEKGLLEKIWSGCISGLQSAGEWCKEHWKFIVTAALVIAAIVILSIGAPVVGAFLVGVAKDLLAGAVVGSIWGVIDRKEGESLFDAFERGAFEGTLSGVAAGLFKGLGIGKAVASKAAPFLEQILSGSAESAVTSIVGDIAKGEVSFPGIIGNAVWAAVGGGVFSSISYGVSFGISKIEKINGINAGRGCWMHVWKTQLTRAERYGTSMHLKTVGKGIGAEIVEKNIKKLEEKITDMFENAAGRWIDEWKKSWDLSLQY